MDTVKVGDKLAYKSIGLWLPLAGFVKWVLRSLSYWLSSLSVTQNNRVRIPGVHFLPTDAIQHFFFPTFVTIIFFFPLFYCDLNSPLIFPLSFLSYLAIINLILLFATTYSSLFFSCMSSFFFILLVSNLSSISILLWPCLFLPSCYDFTSVSWGDFFVFSS